MASAVVGTPVALRLGRGFLGLTLATWLLMMVGALVRAHGAGLSCPDWPLCFGQVIPTFDARVAFEWGHRFFVSIVSFGLIAATVLTVRNVEARRAVGSRLGVAWVLLAAQIVLGGLTVLWRLDYWTVTAHLLTATAFATTLSLIGVELAFPPPVATPSRALRVLTLAVVTALNVQLLLGGLTSSTYSGLACTSFPTCDGTVWFPSGSQAVTLHLVHRWNAFVVLAAQLGLVAAAWNTRLRDRALLGLVLVAIQIGLGITNVLMRLPVEVTALHTGVAAALMIHTVHFLRRTRPT